MKMRVCYTSFAFYPDPRSGRFTWVWIVESPFLVGRKCFHDAVEGLKLRWVHGVLWLQVVGGGDMMGVAC